MKQTLFIAAMLAACVSIQAQSIIRGRVIDAATDSPLTGATIAYAGNKTVTAANGSFTLECGKANSITISYVGYVSIQKAIKNCNDELNITLSPATGSLENVEITATSNQNKSLLYQPSSITKIGTREIKRGTGLFMDDAMIQNVPGVTMNRRSVSGGQQFNIRGYGNGSRGTRGVSSNFDGQGYKVYLNGIPVTDAEGITTLDDIDFGSIGNVEVVKGPSGTLYGLAIAGVVNLKTIKPEKGKMSVAQDVLVGNYSLRRYTTSFANGWDRGSLLINYGRQTTDGYTIHNASHKDFVNAIAEFQINNKEAINTYFGYSNSNDERSGELTVAQFENGDYSGNIDYIKRNAHSNVYTFRAGASHSYAFNNIISNTTTVFGTGFTSNASSAGGWTDKLALNVGLRSTFDTKFLIGNNVTLSGITGVETQRQNAQTIGYGMIDPLGTTHVWKLGDPYFIIGSTATGTNGTTSNIYITTATTSLFTEWTLSLPKDFSVTAGIGWSNMKITLNDRFYNPAQAAKPTHFDTTYKPGLSPHIAINKVFSKEFSVYASYNRAYKAPVSSYFYIPYALNNAETGLVNRHLEAEVGDQFEIGTKGALLNGKLTYQLAAFDAVFKNKFTTIAVPNPTNTATFYSYVVNGGKQDDKGVEALVKTTVYQSATGFFSAVMPFANATYSDFKYKDYRFQSIVKTRLAPITDSAATVDYSDHQVAGVSKWVANVGIDFTTRPGIYGNTVYAYRDAFTLTSLGTADGTPNTAPYKVSSWGLLNAKLGYRNTISHHFDLDIYAAVNNISGTKYPIMVFVNQIPDAYIAGPAKAVYFGGVNLKYIF
jgi:iron complex outermembrane receptor protein